MTNQERIDVLRQSWRELNFECSPTADDLGALIFELAAEWGVAIEYGYADKLVDAPTAHTA